MALIEKYTFVKSPYPYLLLLRFPYQNVEY